MLQQAHSQPKSHSLCGGQHEVTAKTRQGRFALIAKEDQKNGKG
jgi:hypothetical protein